MVDYSTDEGTTHYSGSVLGAGQDLSWHVVRYSTVWHSKKYALFTLVLYGQNFINLHVPDGFLRLVN